MTRTVTWGRLVENITYRDLSKILTVDPAPGRKNSGMPKKQTIRSYLKTIEKQFPNDFKVISEGQQLKLQFITLPQIYKSSFEKSEVNTGCDAQLYSQESLENIEENDCVGGYESLEENSEKSISEVSIYKKHNLNKQTTAGKKLPIADDFYPSPKTIEKAQELGFLKATDPDEIARFIEYNKINETRWENFNKPFMGWLNRCYTHKPKQVKQTTRTIRNIQNEQNNTHNSAFDSGSEMLDSVAIAWFEESESSGSGNVNHGYAC